MASIVQIANKISKGIAEYGFIKLGKKECKNEEQTKQFLIIPFMNLLGYNNLDLKPEYEAHFGSKKGKRVDYAIKIKNKEPEIIIEAKSFGVKLDRHTSQLNEYFINTSSSKIGILTNGIEYRFYVSEKKTPIMHNNPFFTFEVSDKDSSSLKDLARFHKEQIDVNKIIEEANEIIFERQFNEALYLELLTPSRDLISSVYSKMNIGRRLSTQMESKISEMINIYSLKDIFDRMEAERVASGFGVITTKEELQVYNIIRTLLVQSKKINKDRINYRDQKTVFSILIDNNRLKDVCHLKISSRNKIIIINDEKIEFKNIDDLLKLKKKLIDSATNLI